HPKASTPRASRPGRGSRAGSSGWGGGCSTCRRVATDSNTPWRMSWPRSSTGSAHTPEFAVRTNEAGMRLGDDSRGADAAIWRRAHEGAYHGGFRRVPPVLAVEVAGRDEREPELRDKARWYLGVGVPIVWLVLPEQRAVIVVTNR